MRALRSVALGSFALAVLASPAPVLAASAGPAVAPAGAGQAMLGVGYDAKGELRADVCSAKPCSVERGTALGLPRDLAPKSVQDRARTRIAIIGIGAGRRVVWVKVTSTDSSRTFEAVVAAPLAGNAPVVLFAGLTGLAEGEDGVRHGGMVIVAEPDATGARSVAIGQEREEISLCGRPTILEPRVIVASDLSLRPAKVQRLAAEETAAAPRLTATRVTGDAPPAAQLLRAVSASSAIGDPAALTDGNPETSWAENVGGSGRGEFVVMNAPADLPLEGIELAVRPAQAIVPGGAAPKQLFVVTSKSIFAVTLPEDAWSAPGSRYAVRFPEPVRDDCLAVVLESAFDEKPDARVTLSEIAARTAFDAKTVAALVQALPGGGQEAEHAKAVLRVLGRPAHEAVAAAFSGLDEGGRRVALEVLDGASCDLSAAPYVEALGGPYPAQSTHALDHLSKCGAEAAPLLAARLQVEKGRAFADLADQIARIAPAEAVGIFLPLMTERAVSRRAAMRTALGRIAGNRLAQASFRRAFADPATPRVALLDLLRSAGAEAPSLAPESKQALGRLSSGTLSFRERYLGVEPTSALAGISKEAHAALERALVADPDARVRAAAARSVRDARGFQLALVRALTDDSMRVRLEATHALAGAPNGVATTALLGRLDGDPWPTVRARAAAALGAASPAAATDERLARALGDDSWFVRRAVLGALGSRGARAHADIVLERLDDAEEWPDVRRMAARALGELCYEPALGTLTQHARRLADPYAASDERGIAFAALGALRDIAPADLQKRLAPLLDRRAPSGARAAASAAVQERSSRCRPRR